MVLFPIAPYMLSVTDPEIVFLFSVAVGGMSVLEGFLCNFIESIIIMKFDSIFDNKHNKSCKFLV